MAGLTRIHTSFWLSALFILFMLGACSSIPASLDPGTYLFYEKQVHTQEAESKLPLIGMYAMLFTGKGKTDRPEQATVVKGDFKFAAVQRGGDIDFVSMSGFSGFGGLSDQGGSYSINVQGSAYWSFPISALKASTTQRQVGVSTGVIGGRPGTAMFEPIDSGWSRIQVQSTEDNGSAIAYTYFLRKLF